MKESPGIGWVGGAMLALSLVLFGHVLPASRIDRPHGYEFAFSTDVTLLATFIGLLAWQSRPLLSNRIHRSFFGLFVLSLVLKFLNHLLGWRLGIDLRASMALDMLGLGFLCLLGGLTIRPWIHWGALVCALDVAALLTWPDATQPIYAAGNVAAFCLVFGYAVLQYLLRRTK